MKKKGEQFHPSRDIDRRNEKQPEYELPSPAIGGINMTATGHWNEEDLSDVEKMLKREDPEASMLEPAQGRLFDPNKVEGANRAKLGRERFATNSFDPASKGILTTAMSASTIPTKDLQSRTDPKQPETFLQSNNGATTWQGANYAGWYKQPGMKDHQDVIAIDPSRPDQTASLVHEAGHRRHLGEVPDIDLSHHPRRMNPDPLQEGVADGYMDRYGGKRSYTVLDMQEDIALGRGKFDSYKVNGYSTDPERSAAREWNDPDRALYAASRAHTSETGEQALYQPKETRLDLESTVREPMDDGGPSGFKSHGNPTVDATINYLLQAGPHAGQALEQTGLKGVGEEAVRRHQDRQLLNQGQEVQGALFDELRGKRSGNLGGYIANPDAVVSHPGTSRDRIEGLKGELGSAVDRLREDVVPHHMSHNQFGETPRTQKDVKKSLGVLPSRAATRGFG